MIKNENTSISSILDKDTIIGKIMKGLVKVYESFKNLLLNGIPPLTLPKCKGVPLIDYKIYGESVQDGTPTPEAPIEVESVGEKTKNLFDINNITNNINNTTVSGNVIYTHTYGTGIKNKLKELCPELKVGDTVVLSGESNASNNGNLINGIYLSGAGVSWSFGKSLTITQGHLDSYPVFYCVRKNGVNTEGYYKNVQIELGATPTDYEPYGYKIPVKASGKNLLNPTVWKNATTSNNITVQYLEDEDCFVLNGTAISTNRTTEKYINIPIINGSRFSITTKYVSGTIKKTNPSDYAVVYFGANNTINNKVNWKYADIYDYDNKIENEVCNYDYITAFWFYTSAGVTYENYKVKIQLEEGTDATDYEPYIEPVTTNIYLDEPLRKIGDYADYIDFENGKVVRNIGKVVLDGSETDWVYQSNLSRFYKPITDSNPLNKRTPIISNRFISSTSNIQEEGIGFIHSSKIYLYCPTNITSITSFQTWLSTHNTEVVYELATPTEETIDLPNIPTHKGTTIIEVDTSILPSNMEVTYKGKEV